MKDVRVENVPEPTAPGPGEVKVKVRWSGICGSDLHEDDAGPIFADYMTGQSANIDGEIVMS
jgi:(R,R)-butanediol dehydrogenase / meso-butanediol dehydrogenase / diacetyl reductase